VVLASVASACTSLTNLQANPNSGAAGAVIRLTGSNYRNDAGSSPGPVEIRIDSRSSAPIATLPMASINPSGRTISLDVTVPATAALGYHTLIATQYNTTTGALLNGFPVRAAYKVTSVPAPAPAFGARQAATGGSAGATDPNSVPVPAAQAQAAPVTATGAPAVAVTAGAAAAATSGAAAAAPPAIAPGGSDPAGPGPDGTSSAAPGSPPAGPITPVLAGAPREFGTAPAATETISSGLLTAAAERSASVLPELLLAAGAAIVLLSLGASLQSGRTILRRRPTTLA
jgi:S-DNA-T family DNA segregation ATPase FtsK/SpoIIIE